MSTQIDERVVAMKFDSRDFEKNAQGAMNTLDALDKKLQLKDAAKGFENIEKASSKVTLSGLTKSAEAVELKFSAMSIAAVTAISRITNAAITAGTNLAKSMSVDQVTSGFNKLEEKTKAVRTIMSATGESVEDVNERLSKLQWFTDETSYNLTDMTNNIAKFTSNKVPLDDAVTAMQGIATWAASAGQGVNEASRAMYNLSQSIGVGKLQLVDYRSIENANMATAEFKETVMETAVELGRLTKQGEKYYVAGTDFEVSVKNFRDTLQKDWVDSDVLLKSLKKYGEYADAVYDIWKDANGAVLTSDIIEQLGDNAMELGYKAFKAAQEYRTFSDAIAATKDAVSSGWMRSFEIVFGNATEIVEVWTAVGEALWDVFASGAEARNGMLEEWREFEGRTALFKSVTNIWENITNIAGALKDALHDLFPPITGKGLAELTKKFRDFTANIKLSEGALYSLKVILKVILVPFKVLFEILKTGAMVVGTVVGLLFRLADAFLYLVAVGNPVEDLLKSIFGEDRYNKLAASVNKIFTNITSALTSIGDSIASAFGDTTPLEVFLGIMNKIGEILSPISNLILDGIVYGFEMLSQVDFSKIGDGLKNIWEFLKGIGKTVQDFFGSIFSGAQTKSISDVIKDITQSVSDFVKALTASSSNGLNSNLNETEENTGGVIGALKKLTDTIGDLMGKITPAKILIVGFGVSLITLANSISKAVTTTSSMFSSVTGVFNAIKKRLNPTNMKVIAESIMMIAGSLVALSLVDSNNLKQATTSLAILLGMFGALTAGMAVLNKFFVDTQKHDYSESMKQFAISIAALSGSIALISTSLLILNAVNLEGLAEKVLALGAVLTTITTLAIVMAKRAPEMTKGSMAIVSYALAILFISKTLNNLTSINVNQLIASMGSIVLLMVMLKTIGSVAGSITFSKSAGLLLMCVGLIAVVKTLQKLATYDISAIVDGLGMHITLFGVLLSMSILARIAGDGTKRLATTFISISVSLVIVSKAIKKIGELSGAEVAKGTLAIMGIMGMMALIIQASKLSWEQSGQAKMSKGFITMSLSILALMLAVKYLGGIDTTSLVKGEAAVLALMGMFAIIGQVGKGAQKAMGSIIAMTAAVGVLTTALMMLTLIPFNELMTSTAALSSVLIAFGVGLKGLSKATRKGTISLIIKMGVIIGLLTLAMKELGQLDWENSLAASIGLSVVLTALSKCMNVLGSRNFKNVDKNTAAALVLVSGLALVCTGLMALLNNINSEGLIEKVGSLSALLFSLSGVTKILSTMSKGSIGNVMRGVASVSIVITAVGVIAAVINSINSKIDSENIKPISPDVYLMIASVAPLIAACSAIAAILNKVNLDPAVIGKGVLAVGEVAVLIGVISAILTTVSNAFPGAMANGAKEIAEVMLNLGKAIGNFVGGLIGGLGNGVIQGLDLPGIGAEIKGMVEQFGSINPSAVQNFATVAHAMFETFSNMPAEGGLKQIWSGTIDFKEVALGFKDLISGIVGMSDIINESGNVDLEKVKTATAAAKEVATLIPSLPETGGLKQTILGSSDLGLFSDNLRSFGWAIRNYYMAIQSLDDEAFGKISSSATAATFLAELNNKLPSTGGKMQWFFGEKDLKTFGDRLTAFGTGLTSYYTSISTLDKKKFKHITASADAAEGLADLAKKLPSTGGILGEWFFGTQDLGKFATSLQSFADGLKALSTSEINIDNIENVATVSESLVKISNSLDKTGAVKDFFEGTSDLTAFGNQIANLGTKLTEYNNNITGISWTDVDRSIISLKGLMNVFQTMKDVEALPIMNFTSAMHDLGQVGITEFTKTFKDAEGTVTEVGEKLVTNVTEGLANSNRKLYEAGVKVVRGVIQGINENSTMLKSAANRMGDALVTYTENNLEIHSPSRRFGRVAKFCILGLQKGLLENQNESNNAASNVAEHMLQSMKNTLGIHSPSYRVRKEIARPILEAFPSEFGENETAENAARIKAQAILSAFKSGFEDSAELRELMNLERQIFELKLSPDLNEQEKKMEMDAYDLEKNRDILKTYADDYMLAVQQYQTIVREMGEQSANAQEAKKQMIQSELELRKYSAELANATNSQIKADLESQQNAYKEFTDFINSEGGDRMLQRKLRSAISQGKLIDESMYTDVIDTEAIIKAQLDELQAAIEDETWEKKYSDMLQPMYDEFWSEFDKSVEKKPMVTSDDLVRDLLGGMSIDEYSMQNVAADLADSFVTAYQEEINKQLRSSSTTTSSDSLPVYDAVSVDTTDIEEQSKNVVEQLLGDTGEDLEKFIPSGVITTIESGIASLSAKISSAGDWLRTGTKSGGDLVQGWIDGIFGRKQEAEAAGSQLGDDTITALNDTSGIHSPSTRTYESGGYLMEGLANGIRDTAHVAIEAMQEAVEQIIAAANEAKNKKMIATTSSGIGAAIYQVVEESSPVITPVIDLSKVEKDMAELDTTVSSIQAKSISVSMEGSTSKNQNGSTDKSQVGSSSTVTFNQYNNSPKALSRSEIYRQTKNQLSAFEEATRQ